MHTAFSHHLALSAFILPFLVGLVQAGSPTGSRIESYRKNPLYITASGQNSDLETARRLAEKALVSQIQVAIGVTSDFTSNASEDNNELKLTTEFVTRHRSYAGMLFKGLSFIESREKDDWSVFAYIHRDSLAASYALQKSKIVGLSSAGSQAIERGNLGDGLKSLHQAWLLAHFYPDTINFPGHGLNLSVNPLIAIEQLIHETLAGLEIAARDCYRDDPIIMAPLRFQCNGKSVKDLTISYYGGHGMEYARVIDGEADIPLSYQPISSEQRLLVTIEYIFESELKADPELAGLYEMFGAGEFSSLKIVTIRFPWILPEPSSPPESVQKPTISPFGQPVKMVIETQPTITYSEPLHNLMSQKNTPEFLDMLVQYSKLGNVEYGRKGDFSDGIGCHVAVFDDEHVIVFLHFDGFQYRTMDGKTLYSDLTGEFRGKRQVWIKETGK